MVKNDLLQGFLFLSIVQRAAPCMLAERLSDFFTSFSSSQRRVDRIQKWMDEAHEELLQEGLQIFFIGIRKRYFSNRPENFTYQAIPLYESNTEEITDKDRLLGHLVYTTDLKGNSETFTYQPMNQIAEDTYSFTLLNNQLTHNPMQVEKAYKFLTQFFENDYRYVTNAKVRHGGSVIRGIAA